ncbi:hypothetical protein KY334_03500 [Candidatus Woesearchaeota archaeon]|nr:hypothetical protein [Candidatus Woesearchaeota archaeon]
MTELYSIYVVSKLETKFDIDFALISSKDEDSINILLEKRLGNIYLCKNGKAFNILGKVTKTDFQLNQEGLIYSGIRKLSSSYPGEFDLTSKCESQVYIIPDLETSCDIGPAVISAKTEESIYSILEKELKNMTPCKNGNIFNIREKAIPTNFRTNKEGLVYARMWRFFSKYHR